MVAVSPHVHHVEGRPIIRRIGGLDKTDVAYMALWRMFPVVVALAAYIFERFIERPLARRSKPMKEKARKISLALR